jgi:hypothetical protein
MLDYCTKYFGAEHAKEIAGLYKDFYNSYWQPRESVFPGMQRQFLFQDLRYARVFDHISRVFYSSGESPDMNPLREIGYESVPGRTFRIDNAYNKSSSQVDAILYGMGQAIPRFEQVAECCSQMKEHIDPVKRSFFNDNLRIYCYYMCHLSKTLYHYVYAYKNQRDRQVLVRNLEQAHEEAVLAKKYLNEGEHGLFSTWYSNAEDMTRTFQIDSLIRNLVELKNKAVD